MAFNGYEIMRSNIFDKSKHYASPTYQCELDVMRDVQYIESLNVSGDVITVFKNDTEYNPTIVYSSFISPATGFTRETDNISTLIYECDSLECTFNNGDIISYNDSAINDTDLMTINGKDGYCLSFDFFDGIGAMIYHEFTLFVTLSGNIYEIDDIAYEYSNDEIWETVITDVHLASNYPIASIPSRKADNISFWHGIRDAIIAIW